MAGDDIIDDAVVRISPDLTGFRKKLQTELNAATAGITAKVRLQADATGWAASVRKALAARPQATAKVRLVADATGWGASVKKALAGHPTSTKLKIDVDRQAASKATRDTDGVFKKIEGSSRVLADTINKSLKKSLHDSFLIGDAEPLNKILKARNVATQRSAENFRNFEEKVAGELHRIHQGSAEDETRIARETEDAHRKIDLHGLTLRKQVLAAGEAADRESNKRTEREHKRSAGRRAAISNSSLLAKVTDFKGPIDFGGAGIKPTNALIAAAVALSPALIAVASSATLASSSIAAMGAASIGAAAGITAVVVGFTRIKEVLTLRQQVRKEEQRATVATAESAAAERSRARAIVQGTRAVRDSLRSLSEARRNARDADKTAAEARSAINDAYTEAAQRVKDLREELSDLARQEQQDALDVASAKENLASVNNNFWATDLEKRQAALDLQKAIDSQGDTKRDEITKRKELNQLDREGLGQSKEVLDARKRADDANRAAIDAHRAVTHAQEQVTDAQQQLTEAKIADTGATTKATAASSDLAAKVAAMSPAAREMYHWFLKNEGALDKLRSKMEQAVLPGFLTFLKAVTDRRGGASTLDVMADSAAHLGKIIGGTVGKLGTMSKTRWFRGDIKKVNKENEKSFTLLSKAALTLVKPLLDITAASSPLFTRFSKWLLKLTEQFAAFIDKAVRDGSLVQWFKDAGDEAAKWGGIIRDLLGFLKSVFSASLPSGKDLVSRIADGAALLDKWGKSPKGQAALQKFFEFFKNLPYTKIAQFVADFGVLTGGLKVFTFSRKHPFFTLMTLFAAKHPAETADLLSKVASSMVTMLSWVDKHPGQAATALAIITAARYGKTATIGLKLIGLGGLANKIAGAFGKTTTATMTVHAGVVNILGGAGGGVTPGVPTPTGPAGKAPKVGLPGRIGAAAKGILPFLAALTDWPVLAVAVGTGLAFEAAGKPFTWDPVADAQGMWKSFKQTLKEEADGATWDELSGAGRGIGHWFSTTLPDFISGKPGGGWSAAGSTVWTQFKDFVGISAVEGVWAGITEKASWLWDKVKQFWKWLVDSTKSVLGIASPSTVFAAIGGDLVSGLWKGFTDKWDGLVTTVKTFVADKIGGPLKTAFTAVGVGARLAFVTPFNTLTDRLGAPVGKALDWIDTNIIGKLNGVLAKIGVTDKIPLINSTLGEPAGKQVASTLGSAGGKAINSIAKKLASGGPVRGSSPHPRADNIPAMLTANEYVQPVSAVKRYGVGMMDAIRTGQFPRLAKGGLVEDMFSSLGGQNFITKATAGAIKLMGGNTVEAIAQKARDALGGIFGLFGSGTAVPGFGHWPANAASVHGHDSGVWRAIVKLVDTNHVPRNGFGAYNNRRTLRGGWSWHASGHAVDFSGYDQDELAEFFMRRKPSVLELIHSTKKRNYGVSRGRDHDMGSALWSQHKNHLHVAMNRGGLVPNVPMKSYDTGGALAPGLTLAMNGTGRTETVRTATQEKNLNDTRRIDRRDLALLAQYIAAASQRPIHMDGRRVAEIVHGYNYLPGGV